MRGWLPSKPPTRKQLLIGGGVATAVLGALLLRRKDEPAPLGPENVAERELQRWEGLTEHEPAALPILQEYWAAAGQAYPGSPDVPWSGAFISRVIGEGRPGALLPSGSHTVYSHWAYLNRGVPGRYGAYEPFEVRVQPGDIVVRKRAGGDVTFEELRRGGTITPSHGDVVTAVGPSSARAIGGNMGRRGLSTVMAREIPHAGGLITDPAVVAVLRYQPQPALS